MLIKEFAQRTNLPTKTIRYYEEIGLLPPPRRLENGHRDYDEADVARARLVAGTRRDDIQEILDLRDRQIAPCRTVLDLLVEKAGEISRRIAELQCMETELRELHLLGETFPKDDVDGKNCICHLVSEHTRNS